MLNKDNAEGLRKALESLKTQSCPPCKCFDIYIVDGGSSDRSFIVANEMGSKIPCIYWLDQSVKGGTGPARIEILELLRKKGYEYIIWGDSENVYSKEYVERILAMLNRGCDIASGRSVVIKQSIWSEAFYWYHAFHNLFPRIVGSRHAPGNNMGAKIGVYDLASYPPSKRSDDYIFTFSLIKNSSRNSKINRVKYCIDEDAVVRVSMAESLRGVISWQRSRVMGLVMGSLYIGLKIPPDLLSWSTPLVVFLTLLILSVILLNPVLLAVPIVGIISLSVFLHIKSRRYLDKGSRITGLVATLGMILHAFFTTIYALEDLIKIYVSGGVEETLANMREAEIKAKNSMREGLRLPIKSP
ncbi:MAG TPA: glycosyltransferase family 2 protein [Sulfolobales archaeon]|nr:glycosyltransferase family 2 protein [Sulfolobales archaeon]